MYIVLNKLEPTILKNASTQLTVFLVNRFAIKSCQRFFLYIRYRQLTLHCGPTLFRVIMIWPNLNLHYLMMLPHKWQLLLPVEFLEKDFQRFVSIHSYVRIWSSFVLTLRHLIYLFQKKWYFLSFSKFIASECTKNIK